MTATQHPTESATGSQRGSSVYEIVTDRIIAKLEQGVIPWRQPWKTEMPVSMSTMRPYRGMNIVLLACQGYGSRYWLTYRQVQRLGGHVRKGERSTPVVFWNVGDERIVVDRETGNERKQRPILLRYYSAFNLQQTEGIAEKLGLSNDVAVPKVDECERIVARMPNPPKYDQSFRASYQPSSDTVYMPERNCFFAIEGYYSTMFHELAHSTGHPSRLDRFAATETDHRFGSESYSKEELCAEMTAAMLCGLTGIAPATLENSAAYLQSWIRALKGDSKLLVSAASQAQKAADYIAGNVDSPVEHDTEGGN